MSAQTAPTEIEVQVTDTAGKPLQNARVFVTGADATSALTPANGTIRFGDVQAGLYRVQVSLKGYQGASIAEFEALAGRRAIVSVSMQRTVDAMPGAVAPGAGADGTREIGRVRARPAAVSVKSVDVDEDSPIRRVSENLSDALNSIAGVNVSAPPSGNTLVVSINNGNSANSVNSIGGVSVGGAGASTLQAVAADLSTGVSASSGSSFQSVGGSVNFRTLEPTRTWQEQFSSSYGTYEKSSAQLSLTGSYKKLGIAVQHATRGGDSVITGLRFLDQSGDEYVHDGASSRYSDFLKLRYALSPRVTLSGSYIAGTTKTATLCLFDVTNAPCGYGPGGLQTAFASSVNARVQGQIGNVTTSFTVSHNAYSSISDQSQREFLGVAAPYVGGASQISNGVQSFDTVGVGRHTIELNLGGNWGSGFQSFGGAFAGSTPTAFRYGYYVLGDTIKFSDRFSVQIGEGINSRLGSSSNAADIDLAFKPSNKESFDISLGSYGGGTVYNGGNLLSDPADAIFNCAAGTAIVSGYSDPSAPGTYHNLSVNYSRSGRRGSIKVDAFSILDDNTRESVQLPSTVFPSTLYPPGYISALTGYWQNPLICGARPFGPSNVYVNGDISGVQERMTGINVTGQYQLAPNVLVQGSYSINGAVLTSTDPRLQTPGSTYRVGDQLPGRPLHKANFLVDAIDRRAQREWVVNAAYLSGNNGNGLPASVVVAAGVTQTVQRGRLSFFVNNLFSAETGVFATSSVAQPLPTVGGGSFLPTPTLLPPRTYTLLYSVRSGRLK